MYELVFMFYVVTKAGLPGFHYEHHSKYQTVEECSKIRVTLQDYVDKLVKEGRAFPGVFSCIKV